MFVHTVIMVIEPHMKQGRQHKLISTIFLATSVTKKLDHNIYCFFVTEKPAEQSSAGLLRLDTNISRRYYIYFFGAKHLGIRFVDYSMIVATLPEPTVLPPSRIAKRRPCSIATGWISSIVISTLSPGMHISVPSGSSQTPVTSVVLK